MAEKRPQRYIIPVECTQPVAKPYPWEDTWESINNFSPERELGVKEPEHTQPRRRHQRSSQTRHKKIVDENKPPPSRQSYCTTYNISDLHGNKLKVSYNYFFSDLYLRKTLACPV